MKYEPVEYGYMINAYDVVEYFDSEDELRERVVELAIFETNESEKDELIDDVFGYTIIADIAYHTSEIIRFMDPDRIDELVTDALRYSFEINSLIPYKIGEIGESAIDYFMDDIWTRKIIRVNGVYFTDITEKDWSHISALREQDSYRLNDIDDEPWFFVRRNGRIKAVKA